MCWRRASRRRAGRCLLLLHGFPELAYSWRKVMLPLAAAGYHVIAPDQRGYGRTTGWDGSYDADGDPFRILNMVRDATGLVYALGYRSVAGIVGHDAGSPVACVVRADPPDIFPKLAIMSSPFPGPPKIAFNTANGGALPKRRPHRRRARCRAREAAAAAQVLSQPSAHARRQRRHAARAAGPARFLPRLLPLQERRLEREQAASAEGAYRRGDGEDADLLRDGPRQGHGRDGRAVHAVAGRDRRLPMAAPTTSWASMPPNTRRTQLHRRAAGLSCAPRHRSEDAGGAAHVLRPHCRRAGLLHRRQERLGLVSDAGRARSDAVDRLHADGAARISSTAPATGRSRSSRRRRQAAVEFLGGVLP